MTANVCFCAYLDIRMLTQNITRSCTPNCRPFGLCCFHNCARVCTCACVYVNSGVCLLMCVSVCEYMCVQVCGT